MLEIIGHFDMLHLCDGRSLQVPGLHWLYVCLFVMWKHGVQTAGACFKQLQAAACAAGALANLVANNGINQDAAADAAAVEEVVILLSAALAVSACHRQVLLHPAKHGV